MIQAPPAYPSGLKLEDLRVPPRTLLILRDVGVHQVSDFANTTWAHIKKNEAAGKRTLDDLREALDEHGIVLAGSDEAWQREALFLRNEVAHFILHNATQIMLEGEAFVVHATYSSAQASTVRGKLVGLAELGSNNSENSYGWSGIKPVVLSKERLWIMDSPSHAECLGRPFAWYMDPRYAENLPLGMLDLRDALDS